MQCSTYAARRVESIVLSIWGGVFAAAPRPLKRARHRNCPGEPASAGGDLPIGCPPHYHQKMSKRIDKISRSAKRKYLGQNSFEHWLIDNQVYFITARCRDRFPAFATEAAKSVFWDRFEHYTAEFSFVPWVTSLLDNHYHTLGYLRVGKHLPKLMQRVHGSVAKLVNDLLPEPFPNFWRDAKGKEYFDGCIRDEKQARLAYRYVLNQSVRHGVTTDWRDYAHTRVNVELEVAIKRALELNAFLDGVPYKRYEGRS